MKKMSNFVHNLKVYVLKYTKGKTLNIKYLNRYLMQTVIKGRNIQKSNINNHNIIYIPIINRYIY